MNKGELVSTMTEKTGLSKKDAEAALEAFIKSAEEALKGGEKITLVGFGTFEPRKRAARKGRNPQTKEAITIPAAVMPAFKTGKRLKGIVNS